MQYFAHCRMCAISLLQSDPEMTNVFRLITKGI